MDYFDIILIWQTLDYFTLNDARLFYFGKSQTILLLKERHHDRKELMIAIAAAAYRSETLVSSGLESEQFTLIVKLHKYINIVNHKHSWLIVKFRFIIT